MPRIPPVMTPDIRARISATLRRRAASAREARAQSNARVIKHLTPSGRSGPRAHSDTVRAARKAERQAKAWRMLVGGNGMNPYKSFAAMGKVLGVSGPTAWADCVAYANALQAEKLENIAVWRAAHLARAEALLETYLPRALGPVTASGARETPNREAADIVLKVLDREAKLLGLDPKEDGSYTADQVARLMKFQAQLFIELTTDPALRQRYLEELRRRLGAGMATQVLEARPVPPTLVDGSGG